MKNIIQTYQRASIIIVISILINLVGNIVFYQPESITQETFYFTVIISNLIMGFLTYQIAIGKRWARIVFLILMVFYIFSFPKTLIASLASSITFISLWIAEILLLIFASILLVNVEIEYRRRKS